MAIGILELGFALDQARGSSEIVAAHVSVASCEHVGKVVVFVGTKMVIIFI